MPVAQTAQDAMTIAEIANIGLNNNISICISTETSPKPTTVAIIVGIIAHRTRISIYISL